jgi:hypothetical protein
VKYLFIFLLTFLLGILGVIGYGILRKSPGKPIANIIQNATKPTFSIENAPSESIKGLVTQMNGNVFWESRTATEASQIKSAITLQQGEEVQTGENGNVDIQFPKEVSIRIEPKTQIDFVQTLPINFVASIASGSAEFKKLSNVPVTIRTYHLLTKVDGAMSVNVDETKEIIRIKVISGSITTAFNDRNLDSHVANFNSPREIIFNDLTRRFEL